MVKRLRTLYGMGLLAGLWFCTCARPAAAQDDPPPAPPATPPGAKAPAGNGSFNVEKSLPPALCSKPEKDEGVATVPGCCKPKSAPAPKCESSCDCGHCHECLLAQELHAKAAAAAQWLKDDLHSKFDHDRLRARYGYFIPEGSCGHGTPPFGHYHMGYAVNPYHFDPRDAGVFAAQGWGIPMTVPLAPTVEHQFNYGWGIPSSRLTGIYRYINEPGVLGPQYGPAAQPGVYPTSYPLQHPFVAN